MNKTLPLFKEKELLVLKTKYSHLVTLQSLLAQENDAYRILLFQLVKKVHTVFDEKAMELRLGNEWKEYETLGVDLFFQKVETAELLKLGLSDHIPPYIAGYPHYGKTIETNNLQTGGLLSHYAAYALLSGEEIRCPIPNLSLFSDAVEKVISLACMQMNLQLSVTRSQNRRYSLVFN